MGFVEFSVVWLLFGFFPLCFGINIFLLKEIKICPCLSPFLLRYLINACSS